MIAMSLPPQQKPNTKRTGKRITFFNDQGIAMKEASQHTEGSYYGLGGPPSEQSHGEAGAVENSSTEAPQMYLNSVIFSPEKGNQNRGHYQQTMTMKWPPQDPSQQPQERPVGWPQGVPTWGPSFAPYIAGQIHEGIAVQQQPSSVRVAEKQQASNTGGEVFRDAAKANRGLDWEQQQKQQQTFQQSHKPGVLNPQQHVTTNPGNSSVLQPFQLAFGQPKQNLGYFQVYQGNRTLPNLNYSAQANSQHHINQLQQLQQQQQMQRLMMQKQQQHQIQQQLQQQQQLHQQHQQAHQQQQILQQSQQMAQSQQTQAQSQQLNQMPQQMQQQQLHAQQQGQPLQQQQQAQQLLQQVKQQQVQQSQSQKQQQKQPVVEYYSSGHIHSQPEQPRLAEQSPDTPDPPSIRAQDFASQLPPAGAQPFAETVQQQPGPRRSRRLSKEDGAPSENPFLMPSDHQKQGSHNGAPEAGEAVATQGIRAAPMVIQMTRRKRRVSQEVNLETLAQKASEMESLPSHTVKEPQRPWSPSASGPGRGVKETESVTAKRAREENLVPLVIPVSVPVRRTDASTFEKEQASLSASWPPRPSDSNPLDHKPSVIVTRRRSLRNSLSESSSQNGGDEASGDAEGKLAKSKRRPRPEPLFIPPPKQVTFIAPPVYSSITPYQSHLRSPVRLVDNPLTLPPYTPPPILSPVREGSGLYFSTILSAAAAAAGAQGLPPPVTPKSATRSLLRSNSTEITPPVLSAMSEATPVSIEPRINVGQRYQAEVPELRERSAAKHDPHKADLMWAPLPELESKGQQQERVNDLMHLACSSVLCGGGTNQELALHCLHECKGDIMGALALLLLKDPIFPKSHPLAAYHYSGSDCWTPEERHLFNKGIGTYKKDFFMVQKMVNSKTVAQCVEFYYTYKKQVKIGRNGTLLYGEAKLPETRPTEVEVDYKSSQRFEMRKEEEPARKWDESGDQKKENNPSGRVTESVQATENADAVLVLRSQEERRRDQPALGVSHAPPAPPKPRPESTVRRSGAGPKGTAGQEGEFPCKKCGRVFYKVKSRSAHMKSHAEQEKKAAALKQREAEEKAAAAAAAMAASRQNGAQGEQGPRRASSEDSSDEDEDADDEDWH